MKPTEIMPVNKFVIITSKVILAGFWCALAYCELWQFVSSSVWHSDEGSSL